MKSRFRYLICGLLFLQGVPRVAHADLVNCNGVWTNKECDNRQGAATLAERESEPRSAEQRAISQKKLWIQQLENLRFQASNDHKVEVDISAERDLCGDPATSPEQCRAAIESRRQLIDSRILAQIQLETAKRQAASSSEAASDDRDITVIQNTTTNNNWRPRDPGMHRPRPRPLPGQNRPSDNPILKPGEAPHYMPTVTGDGRVPLPKPEPRLPHSESGVGVRIGH